MSNISLPRRDLHVGDVGEVPHPGVVDEDVESAESFDRPRNRAGRFLLFSDVRPGGVDTLAAVVPTARQLPARRVEVRLIAARNDDGGAGVEEPFRNREADAQGPAGDKGDAAGEIQRLGAHR